VHGVHIFHDFLIQGLSNFIWQRATKLIAGWFSGHTFKNHNNCYTESPKLLWKFW